MGAGGAAGRVGGAYGDGTLAEPSGTIEVTGREQDSKVLLGVRDVSL